MQGSETKQSQTSQAIRQRIKFIYDHLIKLGYPKILQLSLSKSEQIETYLTSYFQCTPSRMQLIEWLIAVIMPEYRQMPWYITQKDLLQKVLKALWRIGVMPVNKHTKNLDYKKYVQATIGYENAVNLIFNLVELAFETVLSKKAKQDVSFGQFFHQMIDNFTELVNENYDLYGITFPCKFVDPNQIKEISLDSQQKEEYLDEFQKQYAQFHQQKMIPLLEKEDELFDKIYSKKQNKMELFTQSGTSKKKQNSAEQQNPENQLQKFVSDLAKYGRQYQDKYTKLVEKVDSLLESPQTKSRLIPYYLQKRQQSGPKESKVCVKQSIENRSIKISPEFCKKYNEYKRILRQIKVPKDDKEFMSKRGQILEDLYKINENIAL